MADIQTILSDPDFQGLPLPEKNRVLMQVDPDYAGLPPPERMKALNTIHYNPTLGPMPKEPAPLTPESAVRAVGEGALIGLAGVGQGAIDIARLPVDIMTAAVKPPTTAGEKVAAALGPGGTGLVAKRMIMDPMMRTAEAALAEPPGAKQSALALASGIPIAGPIAASIGESIQKPEDIPFVAGQIRAWPEAAGMTKELGRIAVAPKPPDLSKMASNLSAALEMGGRSAKGIDTHAEVAVPILDDLRAEFARQGKTSADFEGRKGYIAAKEGTEGVRTLYNNAYDSLKEPLLDRPASDVAKVASKEVVRRMSSDTQLLDEIKGNTAATDALNNLSERVSKAQTIGELDDLRVMFNRLATKYEARTEAGQYESPLFQESLSTGADAIRNVLYPEIAREYGWSEADIREFQRNHGAAIAADNLMETTKNAISRAASEEAARGGWWARLRGSTYRLTMRPRHAVGGIIERLFPPSDVELFNTRMKRVIEGATAAGGRVMAVPPTPEPKGTITSEVIHPPQPALPPAPEGTPGPPEPSPPGIPMPPSSFGPGGPPLTEDTSAIMALQARSQVVRDPKTGRMKRIYMPGEEIKSPKSDIGQPVSGQTKSSTSKLGGQKSTTLAALRQVKPTDLSVGDTFIDEAGHPRRVVSIKGNKVRTADGEPKTYTGSVPLSELNSSRSDLAKGGKFRLSLTETRIAKLYGGPSNIEKVGEIGGFINHEGKLIGYKPKELGGEMIHDDLIKASKGEYESFETFIQESGVLRVDSNYVQIGSMKPTSQQIKAIAKLAEMNDGKISIDIGPIYTGVSGEKITYQKPLFSSDAATIGEIQRAIDKIWPEEKTKPANIGDSHWLLGADEKGPFILEGPFGSYEEANEVWNKVGKEKNWQYSSYKNLIKILGEKETGEIIQEYLEDVEKTKRNVPALKQPFVLRRKND